MDCDSLISWKDFSAAFARHSTFAAQASTMSRNLLNLTLSRTFCASFDWRTLLVIELPALVGFAISNQTPKRPRLLVRASVAASNP